MALSAAEIEKRRVALSSVVAAVGLTLIKLVVGLLTNSLGILSEAAHSGLDLIAAGVTYFAVRVSDQPPDREHLYGHGKVENLSALLETILLLLTCVWIVYEAIQRLIEPVAVKATVWAFAVMGISIIVDLSRSRALMRAAKKHNSQALEADALHFSTDVWSSSVVIAGLGFMALADWLRVRQGLDLPWMLRADAVAALGVSAIVVYISYKLGRRTIAVLLDAAEGDTLEKIETAAGSIPGVKAVQRTRVRHSGADTFIDILLDVPRSATFEEAHQTAARVERRITRMIPRSDVMVSIAPVIQNAHSLLEEVWSVAGREGMAVHGIRAHDVRGQLGLEMHIEVPDHLTLGQAHARVDRFEARLREELPTLNHVVTHIEPVGDAEILSPATEIHSQSLVELVLGLCGRMQGVRECHKVNILREGSEISISFHMLMDAETPVSDAHQLTIKVENLLRSEIKNLARVVIHPEPAGSHDHPPSLLEQPPGAAPAAPPSP